jgi:hypothetical protein
MEKDLISANPPRFFLHTWKYCKNIGLYHCKNSAASKNIFGNIVSIQPVQKTFLEAF